MHDSVGDKVAQRLSALPYQSIDLSLERLWHVLHKLGDPQNRLPRTIHVGGTNGKGSTVAFLRAMLEAAGYIVHVYTSPHFLHYEERIRLGKRNGGQYVDRLSLLHSLDACIKAADSLPLTPFEALTAAAFLLFSQHPADYLLLEVGLGGRGDATNVVGECVVASVLTAISIDHQEYLGSTLAAIAQEKAGIFKASTPVILAPQGSGEGIGEGGQNIFSPQPTGAQQAEAEEVLPIIRHAARKMRAPLRVGGEDYKVYGEHGRMVYEDLHGLLDLPMPRLLGAHQLLNSATAIATLRCLDPNFPVEALEAGLLQVYWPGRLQLVRASSLLSRWGPENAEIWLDGAHNVGGAYKIAQTMGELEEKSSKPLILLCGMLQTKEPRPFLRAFKDLTHEVIGLPIPGHALSRTGEDIAQCAAAEGLTSVAALDLESALNTLRERRWNTPPRILILGSLYLIAVALAFENSKLD